MPIRILFVEAGYNQNTIDAHSNALAFGYITSTLRKEYGKDIEIRVADGGLADEIKLFKPHMVGISSVSKGYSIAKENARVAKQAGLPVIIGGVHITALPHTITDDMDVAVIGEGEATIIDVVGLFINQGRFNKQDLRLIPGIAFKDSDNLVLTAPRELIRPIDSIPYPARDIYKLGKTGTIMSSRGCPYHCVFCSTSRHTRNQVRYASAEYVADEIAQMYNNYKFEYITIYDDLFASDPKRVIEIQHLLSRKNLIGRFGIAVNMRTDHITGEIAEVLQQMNVKAVGLGVETGCQETLDYLKSGGITVADNANAIRILRKHHIIPYCSFILGSPYEDRASFMQTVKFIKENRVNHFDVCLLTPFPGTPVWDYAKSHGLVSDDMDWGQLDFYMTENPTILSEKMGRQEIFELYTLMTNLKKHYARQSAVLSYIQNTPNYVASRLINKIRRGEL